MRWSAGAPRLWLRELRRTIDGRDARGVEPLNGGAVEEVADQVLRAVSAAAMTAARDDHDLIPKKEGGGALSRGKGGRWERVGVRFSGRGPQSDKVELASPGTAWRYEPILKDG